VKSALRFLFESELSARVAEFLRSRGDRARIFAPDWVRKRVLMDKPAPGRAFWTSDIASLPGSSGQTQNFIVIAETAEEEKAALETLSLANGSKAYGLFEHIVPALLCGPNGYGRARTLKNLKRFAIFCVPRSGSRYLSTVLIKRGIGAPQEHLREPLAAIVSDGKMGFGPAIAALERFGQNNGIFGTKLISTFLIKASGSESDEINGNIRWMRDRGYQFVYLARPLNETVISSYIAYRMNKWHFFGELDDQARAKLDQLVFDERAAWQEYIRFRAQRLIADRIAKEFAMPVFTYKTLEEDVDTVVQSLCKRLDIDTGGLEPGKTQIPVATRNVSPVYSTFSAKLDDLLARRADEINPHTAEEIRVFTGCPQKQCDELSVNPVLQT
jgi:LPS sulfotransferase NodH